VRFCSPSAPMDFMAFAAEAVKSSYPARLAPFRLDDEGVPSATTDDQVDCEDKCAACMGVAAVSGSMCSTSVGMGMGTRHEWR
jgi:hypothetical protein